MTDGDWYDTYGRQRAHDAAKRIADREAEQTC